MHLHSLIDDRNYNAQVNCALTLSDGNTVIAGEDGLIKIIYKYNKKRELNKQEKLPETYLEKMLDSSGYLANIEDVKKLENGNIICAETLGNIGIYEKTKDDLSSYKLKIINSSLQNKNISSDCIYYLNILSSDQAEIWGETGKKYIIDIN